MGEERGGEILGFGEDKATIMYKIGYKDILYNRNIAKSL